MKAFALPSFADGYVRINLKGRDPQGIVSPNDYNAMCDEICGILMRLRDGRRGLPMVRDIVRTRQDPLATDPKLPDADLIIGWQDDYATDVVESPELGRFGPYPPYRSGSHRHEGFLCAVGPGIAPGTRIEGGHVMDLAPTILQLMGVSLPKYFDGKPLNLQAAQVET
jgi:predicted AlkP superfamily phosphohydrolase/phosphomutase